MLADFDVKVTILEYSDRLVPTEDKEISKELQRILKKKGIQIVTGAKVLPETLQKNVDKVIIQAEKNGEAKSFEGEKLLVSVGRIGNVEGIGLENTDIAVVQNQIQTNEYYQTKESHIYAIGDCIGGLQLAHVASHEGIIAVEHIAGEKPHPLDYKTVSKCIYTSPEISSVGYTEEEAIELGYKIKKANSPLKRLEKRLFLENKMVLSK